MRVPPDVYGWVYGWELRPGMVVKSDKQPAVGGRDRSYVILDKRNTPENRVKIKVHFLGNTLPSLGEISISPNAVFVRDSYTIEEEPG